MVDHQFSDLRLAALYDAFCAGRQDFAFYLPLVMDARSVLDVGCGTGALLHAARSKGHIGRLCGLDPAYGMLQQARRRADIEWVQCDLTSVGWARDFDLVIMTGHAFQVLVGDEELRAALSAIYTSLRDNGRFVFETRNPLARAWEDWTPENAVEITDEDGARVRMKHEVDHPVEGAVVSFTVTYSSPAWAHPETSRSTLRFLDRDLLLRFLTEAGFSIEDQYGDWDSGPFLTTSPEIITVARRGDKQQ